MSAKSLIPSGQEAGSASIRSGGRCGVVARGFMSSRFTRSSIKLNRALDEGREGGFVYQHLLTTFHSISFRQPAAFGYSGFTLGTSPCWMARGTR